MGGFFSSQFQDPEMLKLATQYKVRKVNNVTIVSISQTTTIIMNMIFALQVPLQDAQFLTEHFRSLDRDGEGFFTRCLIELCP